MNDVALQMTPRAGIDGRRDTPFSETDRWHSVARGWRQLFGNLDDFGFSFEWHDFSVNEELDWSRSFHPDSIELCLNLAGHGRVTNGGDCAEFAPLTAGFYHVGIPGLAATRQANERHQFIAVRLSPEFLRRHLAKQRNGLHPIVREVLDNSTCGSSVAAAQRLVSTQQEMIMRLRRPPVAASAQALWYQVRALDLVVEFLFQPMEEFFCTRQQRLMRERVDKVMTILRESLVDPPSLEELARRVNSSPFYLSRIFKQETGLTITHALRQARMERASELLRAGHCNVTEAAMAVGYSSLGHFSTTFQQTFGCCPGLYPFAASKQSCSNKHRHAKKAVA